MSPGQSEQSAPWPGTGSGRWRPADVLLAAAVAVMAGVAIIGANSAAQAARSDESLLQVGLFAALAVGMLAMSRLLTATASVPYATLGAAIIGGSLLAAVIRLAEADRDGVSYFLGVPSDVVVSAILSGVFLVAAYAFTIGRHGGRLADLGFVRNLKPGDYLFAAGAGVAALASLIVWGLVVDAAGAESLKPPESASDVLEQAGGSIFFTLLLVSVWGPIAEEVFFRGFALTALRRRFGVVGAVLLSSALFGLFHISPGAMVPTFALGIALAAVYLKTGSLWPSIFAHGLHNGVAVWLASEAGQRFLEGL